MMIMSCSRIHRSLRVYDVKVIFIIVTVIVNRPRPITMTLFIIIKVRKSIIKHSRSHKVSCAYLITMLVKVRGGSKRGQGAPRSLPQSEVWHLTVPHMKYLVYVSEPLE